MVVKKVLILGNPKLYEVSKEVKKEELKDIEKLSIDLKDTLLDFKRRYNKGRAIASPQIGVFKRVIFMQIDKPIVFINPNIAFEKNEFFEVWDDCMCFPELLVKVRRYTHCKVKYKDLNWEDREIIFKDDLSELFQHEYDHLDGILATKRAIDGKSFAFSSQLALLNNTK